ncbi:RING finger protein 10-like [Macadamia integrifolia]|uniref:RING finger protein 10-like n=1 Tax=Macadamia integrifolia TaxID=60698 RepID=UPI001C4F4ADA|nr:RING finger protein 10-like [Macadamia integrifolia]
MKHLPPISLIAKDETMPLLTYRRREEQRREENRPMTISHTVRHPLWQFHDGSSSSWFAGADLRAEVEFNSMSTRGPRRPLKGYVRDSCRRRMVLDVDLNDTPPGEGRALEEIFTGSGSQQGGQSSLQGGALPPAATIDVEAIDDEVVISSPRSFAEARNKSRRNHGVPLLLEEESGVNQGDPINRLNGQNKRRRVPPNQTIINCEFYINLEGNNSVKNEKKPPELPTPPAPAPPPKEPTFSCPVCMGPLVEEMSTKCGHIFCKKCIKASITAQSKCPTCRRRLTMKDIIRIYLPATN